MNYVERYSKVFKYLLPAPFTIALVLTVVTFFTAFFFHDHENEHLGFAFKLLQYWENGFWDSSLLVFALQMMLMLVLGHVLALAQPVNTLILWFVRYCTNTSRAAAFVTFCTVLVSLFNWGLGLIFGAIFARKVAEYASQNGLKINYPIVGAAGYSGLMVWHAGLSGSSLAKVAEPGHLKHLMAGLFNETEINALPERISYWETVGSTMNITVILLLLLILPLSMYMIGKLVSPSVLRISSRNELMDDLNDPPIGAERLDYSRWVSLFFGGVILFYIGRKVLVVYEMEVLDFFTPNNINLLLFALALLLHQNLASFLGAVDKAITGASGILIQFPLYFGIMGIMKHTGMVQEMADFFIGIANATTYPIVTFLSAGVVNVFVPSGGGQWALQGPIIVQAANEMGLPLSKSILAMAYGDQLTNMLQPFWALPLLGITGLKAKEILPFTLFLMIIGGIIYGGCLLWF